MLKDKQKKAGLTQRKLSELSGAPLRTIQNWEQFGIETITVGNLKKVADALGCKMDNPL